MPNTTKHDHGHFCWADLLTPNVDEAKRFYSNLFEWEHRDTTFPPPMAGAYTTYTVDGESVAGMGPQPPQMKGAPAVWSCVVAVDDADAIAELAKKHGGEVVMPPGDVMDEGRLLILKDPTGAMLSCWQPKNHKGAQRFRESRALCWFELMTRDVAKASAFLSAVFGWDLKPSSAPGMEYTEIFMGPTGIGGIMPMPPEVPAFVPSNWLPYFAVENTAATCEKAVSLGGKVVVPPTKIPRVGTFAVLSDPQGGNFDVITPNPGAI
jgi:hypothetical protein